MNWKRNLNRLWLAQSTSLLGLQVGAISIPLVAVEALHATATEVGLLAAISQLPWLILPPIIGGLADRVDRRRLLIAAHLGRAVLWTTLPIAYLLGVLTLPQLFIVVLLVGLLGMIFEIAYRAFLPQVVPTEGLGAANGRMAATDAVARTSGPALAGFLIQRFSAPATIMVQAVTCLIAGIATLAVPGSDRRSKPDRSRQTIGSWVRDIGAGFGCLARIPALRWITVAETLYLLFFSMCFAVIIVFLSTTAEISAGLIGVIFSVGSLGGLLGAAVANRLWRRFGFDRVRPSRRSCAVPACC